MSEPIWRPNYDAHRESPPRCFRVGGEVTLVNGRCPECGWKDQLTPSELNVLRARVAELTAALLELDKAIHSEPSMDGSVKNLHISPVMGVEAVLMMKAALWNGGKP